MNSPSAQDAKAHPHPHPHPRPEPHPHHHHRRLRSLLDASARTPDADLLVPALTWLCHHTGRRNGRDSPHATSRLRAGDLWTWAQLTARHADRRQAARLLSAPTTGERVEDGLAADRLRALLGDDVVRFDDGGGERGCCAGFADAGLADYLLAGDDDGDGLAARVRGEMGRTRGDAAMACLAVCAAGLSMLGGSPASARAGLVLCAWECWGGFVGALPGRLGDDGFAAEFDELASEILRRVVAVALEMERLLGRPVVVRGGENRVACMVRLREAMQGLQVVLDVLPDLLKQQSFAAPLRNTWEGAESEQKRHLHEKGPLSLERTTYQQHDTLLSNFETAAGALRDVAICFAERSLSELLNRSFGENNRVTDMLFYVASWLGAFFSAPSKGEWSREGGTNKGPYSDHASHVFAPLGDAKPGEPLNSLLPKRKAGLSSPSKPHDISILRWYAIAAQDRFDSLWLSRRRLDTANSSILHPGHSSFAALPCTMHSAVTITPRLQAQLCTLIRERVTFGIPSTLFQSPSLHELWYSTRPALLMHGYRACLAYFVFAILLNQVRRIFSPWLGAYIWHSPIEDLRLALGSPEVFVQESLALPWSYFPTMVLQKVLIDECGRAAAGVLSANGGRLSLCLRTRLAGRFRGKYLRPYLIERWMLDVCRIGFLVWALSLVHYALDRSVTTVALCTALWRTATDKARTRAALASNLHTRTVAPSLVPLLWALAVDPALYVATALGPLVTGTAAAAADGRPGLQLFVSGLIGLAAALTRYRRHVFVALQAAGLFVAAGYLGASAGLLLGEFVGDPLGLRGEWARLGTVAGRARREGLGRFRRGEEDGLGGTRGLGETANGQ